MEPTFQMGTNEAGQRQLATAHANRKAEEDFINAKAQKATHRRYATVRAGARSSGTTRDEHE